MKLTVELWDFRPGSLSHQDRDVTKSGRCRYGWQGPLGPEHVKLDPCLLPIFTEIFSGPGQVFPDGH